MTRITMILVHFLATTLALLPSVYTAQFCSDRAFGYKAADPAAYDSYYVCLGQLGQYASKCAEGYAFSEFEQRCILAQPQTNEAVSCMRSAAAGYQAALVYAPLLMPLLAGWNGGYPVEPFAPAPKSYSHRRQKQLDWQIPTTTAATPTPVSYKPESTALPFNNGHRALPSDYWRTDAHNMLAGRAAQTYIIDSKTMSTDARNVVDEVGTSTALPAYFIDSTTESFAQAASSELMSDTTMAANELSSQAEEQTSTLANDSDSETSTDAWLYTSTPSERLPDFQPQQRADWDYANVGNPPAVPTNRCQSIVPDCSFIRNGLLLRDNARCDRFYACYNGRAVPRKCPTGLYFDTTQNVCNYAYLVDCRNCQEGSLNP